MRVRAAGINFLDILIRHGRYPQMPEFPAVLGVEVAGELEDGTRVMAIIPSSGYASSSASRASHSCRCRTARRSRKARASSSRSSPPTSR